MKPARRTRTALVVLQALMGVAAAGGGADLVLTGGSLMGMPPDLLSGSPFDSFLVPGLVLLAVGAVNLAGAFAMLRRLQWGAPVSVVAGILWVGWFAVQVAVVGLVSWQQPIYFVVGVLILALALPPSVRRTRAHLSRHPGRQS